MVIQVLSLVVIFEILILLVLVARGWKKEGRLKSFQFHIGLNGITLKVSFYKKHYYKVK